MMRYAKDGGENFAVADGETWGVAGVAEILCGDVTGDRVPALVARARPQVAYMDPPWGQANVSNFWSKAGREKSGPGATYAGILGAINRLLSPLECPVFAETGLTFSEFARACIESPGLPLSYVVPITYYAKNPALLHVYRADALAVVAREALTGQDDMMTPRIALAGRTGPVLDLFTGRGLTATTAVEYGLPFYGNELNPFRVSVTLTKLRLMGLPVSRLE